MEIGVPTVKNHVHSILAKLKVARRGEAAARVRRRDTPTELEAIR
jgi:DNA-binding CsgD family transcriptional regulator